MLNRLKRWLRARDRLRSPRPYREIVSQFIGWAQGGIFPTVQIEIDPTLEKTLRDREESRRKELVALSLLELIETKPAKAAFELFDRIGEKRKCEIDLREAESGLYAAMRLPMQVNNGGFHQYFLNSSGDSSALALEWLRHIGAGDVARLLERAAARFPGGEPAVDREERILQLDQLNTRTFRDLDEAFYNLPFGSVYDRAVSWVRANLDLVDLPGRPPRDPAPP